MKKWIFAAAAAVLLTASCEKEKTVETPEEKSGYKGSMEVVFSGQTYTTEDVSVTIDYDREAGTVDISMFAVRFVPQMPVVIDIMIPAVPASVSGTKISFSGDGIVPLMIGAGGTGTPVENYTVSGLSGTSDGRTTDFSLQFGAFPTSYHGEAD